MQFPSLSKTAATRSLYMLKIYPLVFTNSIHLVQQVKSWLLYLFLSHFENLPLRLFCISCFSSSEDEGHWKILRDTTGPWHNKWASQHAYISGHQGATQKSSQQSIYTLWTKFSHCICIWNFYLPLQGWYVHTQEYTSTFDCFTIQFIISHIEKCVPFKHFRSITWSRWRNTLIH